MAGISARGAGSHKQDHQAKLPDHIHKETLSKRKSHYPPGEIQKDKKKKKEKGIGGQMEMYKRVA